MAKEDDTETTNFTFQKLRGADNYKKWRNNMQNALRALSLTKFLKSDAENPPPTPYILTPEQEKDIDWITAAERCADKIKLHDIKKIKVRSLINKMVISSIAKELTSTHEEEANTAHVLWTWLHSRYTEGTAALKWNVIMDVEKISLSNHKNMNGFCSRYFKICEQIDDHKIDYKEAVLLKVLNNLGPAYDNFLLILSSKICDAPNNTPYSVEQIWKDLEAEESRLETKAKVQANATKTGSSDNRSGRSHGGGNSSNSNNRNNSSNQKACKKCGCTHNPDSLCRHAELTCNTCGVKGHIFPNHEKWCKANGKEEKKSKDKDKDSNAVTTVSCLSVRCRNRVEIVLVLLN